MPLSAWHSRVVPLIAAATSTGRCTSNPLSSTLAGSTGSVVLRGTWPPARATRPTRQPRSHAAKRNAMPRFQPSAKLHIIVQHGFHLLMVQLPALPSFVMADTPDCDYILGAIITSESLCHAHWNGTRNRANRFNVDIMDGTLPVYLVVCHQMMLLLKKTLEPLITANINAFLHLLAETKPS